MELYELTIHELNERLMKREVSSVEATQACLDRIEAVDPKVRAFITVTRKDALESAAQADQRIAKGEADILTGIPIALKDIFLTKGIRTTCASRIL
ncbi:MAG TPA: amidase family protein, partial [Geobacteraceae bacterium]|nr:amidase family protein [Geobacteraceae bacterium]